MNRNQRRLGRVHQKRFDDWRHEKSAGEKELQEVFPPKNKRNLFKLEKFTTNKCCYVAPAQEDFGQITEDYGLTDKYQDILKEQFGFDPLIPETINQLKELRKVLCNSTVKVENCSQCTDHDKKLSSDLATVDGSQWQNVDNTDDIDKYIGAEKEKLGTCLYLPENVRISDTPRIKIIAKKFSRFKKNNIELRKLDEKVVCVEYDVYLGKGPEPREALRAFFSIKPTYEHDGIGKGHVATGHIPSTIKNNFNIASDDLKQLNEKEIEIIDSKIEDNKSYLEDLKRILRKKQAMYDKRNKTSLDLMSLYEMAKRECPPLDDDFSNTNFLSKAEMQEFKDLLVRKCASSVHGINRRTVKNPDVNPGSMGVISQSIVAELWREGGTACS